MAEPLAQSEVKQHVPSERTANTAHDGERGGRLAVLSVAALGVVYGDIGTSPLYAFRECFSASYGLAPIPANVLGVLSLILWSLITVIAVKYQLFIMRADNRGEGGILALVALLDPWRENRGAKSRILIILGIFGAALLYGDGVITPAISVLSAVEGLHVAAPELQSYVLPITIAILIGLFLIQRRGTAGVGAVFGPIMMIWFTTLGLLGFLSILDNPTVLLAFSPWYAVDFFLHQRIIAFFVLGSVFLAVTGGEALYADMGHFGRTPIRLAWFILVLPALVLNYLGQGATVLKNPGAAEHPFYALVPGGWTIIPLVILATIATVIASQAVISGAFSLTAQAVQLGQTPRLNIVQTSPDEIGQVYIPALNSVMMVMTIALVVGFGSSSALAAAYGVAVSTTMVITTALAYFVMRDKWHWPLPVAALVCLLFLCFDLPFLGANIFKIADGGWFPLEVGVVVYIIMSTWSTGRRNLITWLRERTLPIHAFMDRISDEWPIRVAGTGVFMTAPRLGVPPMLQHHMEHTQVLHEQVILLTVITEDAPRLPNTRRLEVTSLGHGIYRVFLHYGFMQTPNVPIALHLCARHGLNVDLNTTTFYLGRETLVSGDSVRRMVVWREKLFAFMSRNALKATDFYKIPPQRAIEIGMRLDMTAIKATGSTRPRAPDTRENGDS